MGKLPLKTTAVVSEARLFRAKVVEMPKVARVRPVEMLEPAAEPSEAPNRRHLMATLRQSRAGRVRGGKARRKSYRGPHLQPRRYRLGVRFRWPTRRTPTGVTAAGTVAAVAKPATVMTAVTTAAMKTRTTGAVMHQVIQFRS